jgi:hypothetical protein
LLLQEHHKLVFYTLDPTVITVKENIFYRPIPKVTKLNQRTEVGTICKIRAEFSCYLLFECAISAHHMRVNVNTRNESTGEARRTQGTSPVSKRHMSYN